MSRILFMLVTLCLVACQEQRLASSLTEKSDMLLKQLDNLQIPKKKLNLLLVAYKDDDQLIIYAKTDTDKTYRILQSYPICARSGTLGPKKKEGDKQVPEGFYYINRFNPKSLFYLSLGINYPNSYDLDKGYTGSDIFIHGKCETVGCLPMTDDKIKEIYIFATWAKEAGQQQIPVYIFPFKMTTENIEHHKTEVDQTTLDFWANIQEGYQQFQTEQKELTYSISGGKYIFN